jgi:hypothetical protein
MEYEVRYGAAAGELLVLTPKLGEFRRLYRTRDRKTLVPVTPEMRWDVSDFAIDLSRRRILHSVNEAGYTRLRALDARTFRPLALPRLPEADHVYAGFTTRDGQRTTLGVETARRRAPATS